MALTDAKLTHSPNADRGAIAVIPARFASSRFPGKPLVDQTGKPLIQHVVERVRQARRVDRVIVATDDQRIFDATIAFGGDAVMTRGDHPNGTSRIAEVVEAIDEADPTRIIVNVQGDEPEIEPNVIDQLITGLEAEPDDNAAPMATLASDFSEGEDPRDPNIVKIVVAWGPARDRGRALYFSRSLVPYDRDGKSEVAPLKHPGLYAYRAGFLPRYAAMSPTPLEQAERLEQLRALEHGVAIAVVKAAVRHHGIDTPEQYAAFVQRIKHGTAATPAK